MIAEKTPIKVLKDDFDQLAGLGGASRLSKGLVDKATQQIDEYRGSQRQHQTGYLVTDVDDAIREARAAGATATFASFTGVVCADKFTHRSRVARKVLAMAEKTFVIRLVNSFTFRASRPSVFQDHLPESPAGDHTVGQSGRPKRLGSH